MSAPATLSAVQCFQRRLLYHKPPLRTPSLVRECAWPSLRPSKPFLETLRASRNPLLASLQPNPPSSSSYESQFRHLTHPHTCAITPLMLTTASLPRSRAAACPGPRSGDAPTRTAGAVAYRRVLVPIRSIFVASASHSVALPKAESSRMSLSQKWALRIGGSDRGRRVR